ncbi:YncE family protein [Fodinibius sp.]|uniref:YncE family protein n=1 Tax=Fodinibius sp. TaxID=1872440 RepID=UPI00356713CE
MKQGFILFLSLLVIPFLISSCADGGNNPDPLELSSVYVTNEGNFSDSDGSLTSYDPESGSILKKAFENANGRPLAGIIQSSKIAGEHVFIVLNDANKIEVAEIESLESVATIELSTTPTDFEIINNQTGYVSNLYDGSITVIDLENFEETGQRISVGSQPRTIFRLDNRAYVANNGAGNDHTISVINTTSHTVDHTIEVGAGPADISVDMSGRLWVVCNGLIAYDENWERDPDNDKPGSVYLIDGSSATVIDSIATGGHPSGIALANEHARAYLLNDGISVIDMNTLSVEEEPFSPRSFNAIGYLPTQERLYVGDSRGYGQAGQALIYDLQGTAVDSFSVGIAPNGFHFMVN